MPKHKHWNPEKPQAEAASESSSENTPDVIDEPVVKPQAEEGSYTLTLKPWKPKESTTQPPLPAEAPQQPYEPASPEPPIGLATTYPMVPSTIPYEGPRPTADDEPDLIRQVTETADSIRQLTAQQAPVPSMPLKEWIGYHREARLVEAWRYLRNLAHIKTIRDDKEIIAALAEHLREALGLLPVSWLIKQAEEDENRLAAEAKQGKP